jgi:hypothetical protein
VGQYKLLIEIELDTFLTSGWVCWYANVRGNTSMAKLLEV